jgi:hypothetical protein
LAAPAALDTGAITSTAPDTDAAVATSSDTPGIAPDTAREDAAALATRPPRTRRQRDANAPETTRPRETPRPRETAKPKDTPAPAPAKTPAPAAQPAQPAQAPAKSAEPAGTLRIELPAGVTEPIRVLVDGQPRGNAPTTIKLSPGLHEVTFIKGNSRVLRMVSIKDGKTNTLKPSF